jgi:glucosamine--fructose-6-phosphate aminotransferase (isomerizing)
VASTKAFTAQLVALHLLALRMASAAGALDADALEAALAALAALPRQIERTLALDAQIAAIAQKYYRVRDFLFLGRGILHPIALEGALKLKEISYIHAEGHAAGELKHGPIALVDESVCRTSSRCARARAGSSRSRARATPRSPRRPTRRSTFRTRPST